MKKAKSKLWETAQQKLFSNCVVEMTWFSSTGKLQRKTESGKKKINKLKDAKDSNHPDVSILKTGSDMVAPLCEYN